MSALYLQKVLKKIPAKTMATTNFKKVPVMKPKKEPKAAFSAVLLSALLMISPTKAPIKGQIIMPNKPKIGKIKEIISPTVVPIIPVLLPPNRLVPAMGMM